MNAATLRFAILLLITMSVFAKDEPIPLKNRSILEKGDWQPTREEVDLAAKAIERFLAKPENVSGWQRVEIERIKICLPEYRVQFKGIKDDGKKLIWCNFFPGSKGDDRFNYWSRHEVCVYDGGFWYWFVMYDPKTDRCVFFCSNGYA
jgi:hypothetical protein